MDIDDTENPFDTGAVNPGYDETGEMNEMDRFPSSSSRRGSEDTTYHRTRGETSQRFWSWNSFFWVGLPLAASLGGLGLICGVVSVITGEAGKNVSRKVTKHEKTVSVCESKINSLKDRISKALADDRISDEEFENILAEMSKYNEMKKDIRVGFKKNKVKKTRDGVARPEVTELRREIHAEILKKLALEEDRRK